MRGINAPTMFVTELVFFSLVLLAEVCCLGCVSHLLSCCCSGQQQHVHGSEPACSPVRPALWSKSFLAMPTAAAARGPDLVRSMVPTAPHLTAKTGMAQFFNRADQSALYIA